MRRTPARLCAVLSATALSGAALITAAAPTAFAATTTTWSTALSPGTYQVTIKHPASNANPGRVSVVAEGRTVFESIDFAWDKTFDVAVTDGSLDLALTGESSLHGFSAHPVLLSAGTPIPAPAAPSNPAPSNPAPVAPAAGATGPLGPSRSGQAWLSGARIPGFQGASGIAEFESFRGSPLDAVVSYGRQDSYWALANETWPVAGWNGFPGRLVYSLPLIPWDHSNSLANIARGDQDWVWQAVARQLRDNNRGDSIIRVGWEYNIGESPWMATASTVDDWKAAFRRVVTQMRPIVPGAKFEFGINCGSGLIGAMNSAADRLNPLTMGYPGDDVVDIVGCDSYDWWQTKGSTEAEFARSLRPAWTPGIGDVADFARAHGKLIAFGEWGLAGWDANGGQDDDFYIRRMHQWFTQNRDILAVECYFDDPTTLGNSLARWQLPKAAAAYRDLW